MKVSSDIVFLPASEVFWIDSENERKDYGSEAQKLDLAYRLTEGWNSLLGIIRVTKPKAEEVKAELDRRTKIWDALKAAAKSGAKEDLVKVQAFEHLYCTGKAEKMVLKHEIKAKANMCFRRGSQLLAAIELCLKGGSEGQVLPSEPPVFELPVQFVVYDDEVDRRADQLMENTGKAAGSKRLTDIELFRTARVLYTGGYKEAKGVKMGIKRGTAQKLWSLFDLDVKFSEANLADRVERGFALDKIDAYEPDGPIPFGPLDKEDLRKLYNGELSGYTDDSVSLEKFVADKIAGRVVTKPTMKRPDIENLRKQNGTTIVNVCLDTVLDNTLDPITRHFAKPGAKAAYNAVFKMIEKGEGEAVVTLLGRAVESKAKPAEEPASAKKHGGHKATAK